MWFLLICWNVSTCLVGNEILFAFTNCRSLSYQSRSLILYTRPYHLHSKFSLSHCHAISNLVFSSLQSVPETLYFVNLNAMYLPPLIHSWKSPCMIFYYPHLFVWISLPNLSCTLVLIKMLSTWPFSLNKKYLN